LSVTLRDRVSEHNRLAETDGLYANDGPGEAWSGFERADSPSQGLGQSPRLPAGTFPVPMFPPFQFLRPPIKML
jgi:hypothetical protein